MKNKSITKLKVLSTTLTVICLFIGENLSAQYGRLGFTNDVNGGLFMVNYKREEVGSSSLYTSSKAKIKFYNANFRFGGSLIGPLIFKEESRLFIGEYFQFGLGVGMGSKSGTSNAQYNGTTFNVLLGMNIGGVASYAISEDLTVGLKVIALGGDLYFDFDQNPVYVNGLTFHPTVQFSRFLLSAGFGGTNRKGIPYKTFETEFRFNFSDDQANSSYLGIRYQRNSNEQSSIGYVNKESIGSIGLTFGAMW